MLLVVTYNYLNIVICLQMFTCDIKLTFLLLNSSHKTLGSSVIKKFNRDIFNKVKGVSSQRANLLGILCLQAFECKTSTQ